MKYIIFIIILVSLTSCTKEVKKKIELNRDISIKYFSESLQKQDSSTRGLDSLHAKKRDKKQDLKHINGQGTAMPIQVFLQSKDTIFPKYNFKDKPIKYSIKSEQFFDSNINSFIIFLNLTLNFKPSYDDKTDELIYDIYISDFSLKEKVFKGNKFTKSMFKKYETLFKSTFFVLKIDSYGKKTIKISDKISFNPHLKKMSGFIFNIVENIFFEFNLENDFLKKEFSTERKFYSIFKKDIRITKSKMNILQKNNEGFILLNGKNEKMEYNFLFSKKEKLPIEINYLKKDSYTLDLNKKSLSYKIKNYYFIRKL